MQNTVNIIMYHYVRELPLTRYPGIKGLRTTEFKQQIEFLEQNDYNFISVKDIFNCKNNLSSLPGNPVLLTFDDGYIDHYTDVFPILNSKNIPAFFSMPGKILKENALLDVNRVHFILASADIEKVVSTLYEKLDFYRGREFDIPSNEDLYAKCAVANRWDCKDTIFAKRILQVELPENLRNIIAKEMFASLIGVKEEYFVKELYMSMDQIKLMQKHGMEWGIHGYDHYWMNRMDREPLKQDITKALDVFDGIVPTKNWVCCYPYGSVSDGVIDVVKELGAGCGLTTEVKRANLDKDCMHSLPRLDTNDFPPKSDSYIKIQNME